MNNFVTQAELDKARETYTDLSGVEIELLREGMAEEAFERQAAFGRGNALAPAAVEETGEGVSAIMYQIVYNARVAKLFEGRDNEHA